MKKNHILPCILTIIYLFTLTAPASAKEESSIFEIPLVNTEPDEATYHKLARLNPADVATTTDTEYPLSAEVFPETNFLFIRRYGDQIGNASIPNSSRIASNADNQIVSWEDIWKIDEVELANAQTYTVKIHFDYDYQNYSDKEFWLYLSLPETTEANSISHLTAILTLIDPDTGEGIAQTSGYIILRTLDTGQALQFHPSFTYTRLPNTTTETYQTAEQLTSDGNILIKISPNYNRGIILINFQSKDSLQALLAEHSTLAWNNLTITPISPDKSLFYSHPATDADNIDINPAPDTAEVSIPTAPSARTTTLGTSLPQTASYSSEPSAPPQSSASNPNAESTTHELQPSQPYLSVWQIAIVFIIILAIHDIAIFGARLIWNYRKCNITRKKRRQRRQENDQRIAQAIAAEHAHLFDDNDSSRIPDPNSTANNQKGVQESCYISHSLGASSASSASAQSPSTLQSSTSLFTCLPSLP